jgi:hypothetical protein
MGKFVSFVPHTARCAIRKNQRFGDLCRLARALQ